MLFDYTTKREAIQAGWAYASGRLDQLGRGDLPRTAGAGAFGEEYGRVWEVTKMLRRGDLPSMFDAWANWLRCNDNDLPLQLFDEDKCCSCGGLLNNAGLCPSGQCVPVTERKPYQAFRVLAEAYRHEDQYADEAEVALKAVDAIAELGRYSRNSDVLRRWCELYAANAVA